MGKSLMPALWLENQHLSLRSVPIPQPPPGEALVRVRLAGICGTDLELLRGYYPYAGIPGHEFVGEVVAAGDSAWVGRRVVGEINAVCGVCTPCRAGRPHHCEQRSVLGIRHRDGAFAGYLCLPEKNLHAVPDGLPDAAAVFVEPLAAALRIQQQVAIGPGTRVLVVGAGRLGQLVARSLIATGCEVRAVARYVRQRQLLTERGIPTLTETELPLRHYDVVVEATGVPSGFELARRAVRPCGTLVLKSTYRDLATVDLSALVVDEISLVGSRCGPFPEALRLLAQGALEVMDLIEAEYPLAEAIAALERASQSGALKVLLRL